MAISYQDPGLSGSTEAGSIRGKGGTSDPTGDYVCSSQRLNIGPAVKNMEDALFRAEKILAPARVQLQAAMRPWL